MNAFYWPLLLFYLPYLVVRARHICFFTAANPGIYTGGLGLESKFESLQKIPIRFRPKSILVSPGERFNKVLKSLEKAEITFPLIAKPDIGFRGMLVKKISDPTSLKAYLQKFPIHFILQEFIDFPEECGILYYRYPGQKQGEISSITLKAFLKIKGDGISTVEELIRQQPRAILQLDRIKKQHPEVLNTIPGKGERVPLGIIGNHSKGTMFMSGKHLIDADLIKNWDRIWAELDGVYYCRFDIKGKNWEAIKKGEGIKILEMNGICSEPTHIYDPVNSSYFKAIRDILKHWTIIYRIARKNHASGTPYMNPKELADAFRALFAYQKRIEELEASHFNQELDFSSSQSLSH